MENASYQNIPVVEAKAEYTRQLKNILVDQIQKKMISIYQQVCIENEKQNQNLMEFQKKLRGVLEWNPNIISNELKKITDSCSWFNDLLAAVIVTNVKILTSVKLRKSKKKIQIKMPSSDDFLHKVYINTARRYYENPYIVQSKDNNAVQNIIFEAIEDAIRDCLPVQNILQLYLGDAIHGENLNSDDDDEKESVHDENDDDEKESVHDENDDDDDEDEDSVRDENHREEAEISAEQTISNESPEFSGNRDIGQNHVHEHRSAPVESKDFFDKPVETQVKNLNIQGGQQPKPSFFADTNDPNDDEFVGDN